MVGGKGQLRAAEKESAARSVRPSAPYPAPPPPTSVSGVHAPSPEENALWGHPRFATP